MTLLIIQEQHFTQLKNGQVWVNETSNIKFWDRYLDVFDRLIVCARIEKLNDNNSEGLIRSDRKEITFVELPNFRGIKGLLTNIRTIRKQIKYAIYLSDRIIFRAPSPISLVAYPLIKNSGKPFALELMNNPITQYSKKSMNSILQPLIQHYVTRQTKDMCMTANGVSYVTEHELQKLFPCRALLTNVNSSKYFTSYYSTIRLDEDNYCFKDMSEELPKPLIMINGGKMNDFRKGQDMLIKCVKRLRDAGHDVILKLMGTGVMEETFRKLASDKGVEQYVSFEGWKAGYQAVQQVLQSGHLFVFPSLGEGLPRSVIEAMANGLLVVASDVDGTIELLPKSLMVHHFDTNSFTNKLEDVIENWKKYSVLRMDLYEKSKEYENSKLRNRRKIFYQHLKDVVIK